MIVRFFQSRVVARTLALTAFGALGLGLSSAGCSTEESSVDAQIRQFCDSLLASPGFACCSAADRSDPLFGARYQYASTTDCNQQLQARLGVLGRRGFDATAASSCLAHIGSRTCGAIPTVRVKQAEEAEGCARVIGGVQNPGQPCETQGDCKPGSFCPSTKETGSAVCSPPGASNNSCFGEQATSIDHPTCGPGLVCILSGQAESCPTPPCNLFTCVPRELAGEPCTGLECANGLTCLSGICRDGGPGPVGTGCTLTDQCAEGLFCDPTSFRCAARKDAGDACNPANTARFECKGACQGSGASGVCSAFCASG